MSAPLTTAKLGSVRCVGCEKRFADTPDLPVTETEAQVENRGRIDSIGQLHRGIGTHAVTRLWHAACLAEFEARNEAYRAKVAADNEAMIRSLCDAAGLDYEAVKAEHERRQAGDES